jgi:hypothetical protein
MGGGELRMLFDIANMKSVMSSVLMKPIWELFWTKEYMPQK